MVRMAEVIIDGARRRQIEGTSLADLQVAYPLCWLERDDGVEIRLPKYVLEKDRHYVLINNESSGIFIELKFLIYFLTSRYNSVFQRFVYQVFRSVDSSISTTPH